MMIPEIRGEDDVTALLNEMRHPGVVVGWMRGNNNNNNDAVFVIKL